MSESFAGVNSTDTVCSLQSAAGAIPIDCRREVCRGASSYAVLQNCGKILANSKGSAATYSLSKPVSTIDCFISHNWSTPRWGKYLVLAFYFNHRIALMAASITLAACFLLSCLGLVPLLEFASLSGNTFKGSRACMLLVIPTYIVALLWGHEAEACVSQGKSVFLDKVCIHQTDPVLMREGIKGLAAFINHSDCMLVVYADTYLVKAWTVYELASFMALKSPEQLVVMPLIFPKLILFGTIMYYMFMVFSQMLRLQILAGDLPVVRMGNFIIFQGCAIIISCFALRVWARDFLSIRSNIQGFHVREANCFDPSDKPLIHAGIHAFMEYHGFIGHDWSEDRALDFFDSLVQKEMPRVMLGSLKQNGLAYHQVLIIFSSHLLYALDVLSARINEGTVHGRDPLIFTLGAAIDVFVYYPFTVALAFKAVKRMQHLRGFGELLFVLLVCFAIAVISSGRSAILRPIIFGALNSWMYFAVFLLACCIQAAVTIMLYRPWRHPARRSEEKRPSVSASNGAENGIEMFKF